MPTDARDGPLPMLLLTLTIVTGIIDAVSILSIAAPHPRPDGRDLMLIVLGAAMGSQNAAMRRIGVVGLPTANVVTTTLTGLLADIAAARPGPRLGRRMATLAAITVGAALGAVLVIHTSPATALSAATGLLALVAAATHRLSLGAPDWCRPPES